MTASEAPRIITREREQEERLIRQGKRIDKMSPTIGEVKEMMTELYGPMAALLREMCVRQALLEDWFGLTFVPATEETPDHFVRAAATSPDLIAEPSSFVSLTETEAPYREHAVLAVAQE